MVTVSILLPARNIFLALKRKSMKSLIRAIAVFTLVIYLFTGLIQLNLITPLAFAGNRDRDREEKKDDKKDNKKDDDKDKKDYKDKDKDKDHDKNDDKDDEENECKPTPTPTPSVTPSPTPTPTPTTTPTPTPTLEEEDPEDPEIGGLVIADLDVDKRIYNPKSKDWANSVEKSGGSFPYIFQEDDKIKFKVTLKNVGDVDLVEIKLYDYLPDVLKYDSGNGDYKEDKNMIEFGSVTLKPGESKSYEYVAELNEDYGLEGEMCTENYAEAEGTRDDTNETETGDDNAEFCIEATNDGRGGMVLGASTGSVLGKEIAERLPTTGAFDLRYVYTGIQGFFMTVLGWILRKLGRNDLSSKN